MLVPAGPLMALSLSWRISFWVCRAANFETRSEFLAHLRQAFGETVVWLKLALLFWMDKELLLPEVALLGRELFARCGRFSTDKFFLWWGVDDADRVEPREALAPKVAALPACRLLVKFCPGLLFKALLFSAVKETAGIELLDPCCILVLLWRPKFPLRPEFGRDEGAVRFGFGIGLPSSSESNKLLDLAACFLLM